MSTWKILAPALTAIVGMGVGAVVDWPDPLVLLIGVAGAVGSAGLLLSEGDRGRRVDARLGRLVEATERLAAGEGHVFAPAEGADATGRLGTAINTLADRLRREHLDQESQRLLEQAMIRETPNGMVMVDGAGRVRSVNPSLRELLQVRGELVGGLASEVLPIPELHEALAEAARTRVIAERTRAVANRDLLLRAIPLADGVGCMGLVLDVTSLRLAERARRDFVANVSHELRTPVTAIVGYAETLLEDRAALPPWSVPMLEAMERNAHRLLRLVEDVLQLSKIEARGTELPLQREPLAPIVSVVVDSLAPKARDKGVSLVVDLAEGLSARVNAEALDHALGNLVDNAVKYAHPGGSVRVTGWTEGDRVRLEVADDGPGIAPEHQERIFERFYRGDPARSKAVPGTGLGLALVKHLCLAMQAEVRFESRLGKGSRFWLSLPA